jgi:hypothetical protein
MLLTPMLGDSYPQSLTRLPLTVMQLGWVAAFVSGATVSSSEAIANSMEDATDAAGRRKPALD